MSLEKNEYKYDYDDCSNYYDDEGCFDEYEWIRTRYNKFCKLCSYNTLTEIKKYYEIFQGCINISEDEEYIFRYVCEKGRVEVAKWARHR